MQLVKQFMPTLLAGDDLGYTMPLGNEEQARIYAGLGYVQNLSGDDLLGDDLLGDDLLGDEDDLFGDEYDDLSGYNEISSQGVTF
jgi:hypothetical protein